MTKEKGGKWISLGLEFGSETCLDGVVEVKGHPPTRPLMNPIWLILSYKIPTIIFFQETAAFDLAYFPFPVLIDWKRDWRQTVIYTEKAHLVCYVRLL